MPPDRHRKRDGSAMRAAIREAVAREPGLHLSALKRMLDIGWGTTQYHLRILVAQGQLQMVERGRERRLFPPGVTARQQKWLSALQDEVDGGILRALQQEPGVGMAALAARLGHSRRILRQHLGQLGDDGLVHKRGEHRPRFQLQSGVEELALPLRGQGAPREIDGIPIIE